MTTIGFIGSGLIGGAIARHAVAHGYDVVVSNSRGPETLADLVAELGEHASAATAQEAAARADFAVVSIPFKAIYDVPVEELAGKVVIDTNNYYPQRDGQWERLDDESSTNAELLQEHLPTSKVVKAFNNINYVPLGKEPLETGSKDRRALSIAGDDPDAKAVVTELIEKIGFDVVDAGPLSEGWRYQRDTAAYGPRLTVAELKDALASAKRYRDM
jgi:predicted dinucleotide-binding enzyme